MEINLNSTQLKKKYLIDEDGLDLTPFYNFIG